MQTRFATCCTSSRRTIWGVKKVLQLSGSGPVELKAPWEFCEHPNSTCLEGERSGHLEFLLSGAPAVNSVHFTRDATNKAGQSGLP